MFMVLYQERQRETWLYDSCIPKEEKQANQTELNSIIRKHLTIPLYLENKSCIHCITPASKTGLST